MITRFSRGFATLFAFALSASAAAEAPRDLNIRIYTSPSWCKPCQRMQAWMRSAAPDGTLTLNIEGASVQVPFLEIDVDKVDVQQERLSRAVPEIQLYSGNNRLGAVTGERLSVQAWNALAASILARGSQQVAQQPAAPPPPAAPSIVSFSASAPRAPASIAPPVLFSWGPPSGQAAVILAGTGASPLENPIGIGMSLRWTRRVLSERLGVRESDMITLYGFGTENQALPEAYERSGSVQSTAHVTGLLPTAQFTRPILSTAMQSLRRNGVKNALVVMAGHASAEGVSPWSENGNEKPINARELRTTLSSSGARTVLVSGTCFSGRFASSASCGFFASRPDQPAFGCSPDAAQRPPAAGPRDYVSMFFDGFGPTKTTFADAHWYAFGKADRANVPYTSVDAWADRMLASNPALAPGKLTVTELLEFRGVATPAERLVFDDLYLQLQTQLGPGAPPSTTLNFATRAPSKLVPLIRRLAARRAAAHGTLGDAAREELRLLDACEGQSLSQFLKGDLFASRVGSASR